MQNKFFSFWILLVVAVGTVMASEDPTRPPAQSGYRSPNTVVVKTLRLQGLVVGKNSWVIVNDIAIQEGETKKGIKVIQIKKDRVLIRHNGEKIWLPWKTVMIRKKLEQSL